MSNTSHFPIEPINRFERQSGTRQPVELTSFSFDAERRLHHDDSSLTYYWPITKINVSLSTGFESLVSRDESINEHIDALLSSLIQYELANGTSKTTVDIVTWRGMITKFLTLPYARGDGFEMNVVRLGDTIFMEEYTTPQSRLDKQKRESDPRQRLMSYWGYKYEALATVPHIWDETSRETLERRDTSLVNTNVQYCSVVRTRLGPVSMILAGEVDCCSDYKPEQLDPKSVVIDEDDPCGGMKRPAQPSALHQESVVGHYLELKTTKLHTSSRDRINFEKFKLLKFWAQSFLLGIPRIVVGFRDNDGRLQQEEEFETLKIPKMVRMGSGSWDGNVCLNFAGEVLKFIKDCVMRESDASQGGVWRIKYAANTPSVQVYKVEEQGHGDVLTKEFLQHRSDHQQSG